MKEVKKVHSGIFFYNYSIIACKTCGFIKVTVPINLINTTNKIQPIIVNANIYVNDKKQIELSSYSFKINPADSLKTDCIYDVNMHTIGPSRCMLELSVNNKVVVTYVFKIEKENNIAVTNNI